MHNNRTTVVLHQELVLDVGYVGDGQVVAAFISTTAGLPPAGPRGTPAAYARHARTHAPVRRVPARPRRSTLPGLLPVSHLQPIAEARAIDDAHSRRRGTRRRNFLPLCLYFSLFRPRGSPPRPWRSSGPRRRPSKRHAAGASRLPRLIAKGWRARFRGSDDGGAVRTKAR